MFVTRRLEFDAGHRIPDHKSQCKHLHGHRYVLEITLSGEPIDQAGDSSNGMVMDFSEIKALAKTHLVNQLDHAFIVFAGDTKIVELLNQIPHHKTVLLEAIPTAENIARHAFNVLNKVYSNTYGNDLRLESVRLYETPNCWAEVFRGESA